MRLPIILLVVAIAAAATASCLADPYLKTTRPGLGDARADDRSWATMAEPSAAIVEAGDPAPDFSYQADSGEWLKLHELLDHGNVILVFAPQEDELRGLQAAHDSLTRVGIVPVAVLDRKPKASLALMRKLGLQFPVVSDPMGTIATQFNLVSPPTLRTRPGWFVVDRKGRVRALDRTRLPQGGYMNIACGALAIPNPAATATASSPAGAVTR